MKIAALPTTAVLHTLAAFPVWAQTPGGDASPEDALVQLVSLVQWRGVATSVLVIVIAYFGLRFVDSIVSGLSETFTDRRLLLQKIATFVRFGVYIVTFLLVFFLSFVVDDRMLTILGGVGAVALGFAMKDLVASVVAGVMIMFDRPFQVGDRVQFAGEYGDITAIGLRSVRLVTLDDSVVTIPNNKFLNDVTVSGNYGELDMMVAMDFHIGMDQDVTLAGRLIRQATATSRYTYLAKPIRIVVRQVIVDSYVAVRLTMKAYVLDTQYEKAFETDINVRVLETFREHGIKPPAILHRTLPSDREWVPAVP